MRPTFRTTGPLGVAVALLLGVAACTTNPLAPQEVDGLTCPGQAGGPVTLVIGARANSPAPVVPDPVQGLIREAAKQSKKVQVVRIDGEPAVTYSGTFRTNAANDIAKGTELDTFLKNTEAQIVGLRPKAPEADVLGALDEAARVTPRGGTIVLMDSGLQTAGSLKFQVEGTFGAQPKELIAYLAKQNQLPKLDGLSVLLVGIGNTAEPQVALDPGDREQLTALWKSIVDHQKPDCVDVLGAATNRTSIQTDVAVSLVPIPVKPDFKPCGTTVLADSGTVGFVADEAVFRDPAAARRTLQSLADKIRGGRQKVTLIGTTSSWGDSEAGRIALSKQRAAAVKAVLVELGIEAGRITTKGAGSKGPNHVNDRLPDGSLDPAKAARNRSVVVQLTCAA